MLGLSLALQLTMWQPKNPAKAFEAAIAAHTTRLYQAAYRLTGRKADAEDLFQELLLKLFRQLDQWHSMDNPQPWFMRVLYNLHIDRCRKIAHTHGANETTLVDSEQLERQTSQSPAPPDAALAAQRQQRILRALDTLEPAQRALVVMHLLEGYTLSELAKILGEPLGTLKSRLHRVKAQLRDQLLEPFL